ncbi:type I 3-dehydroquinate dehydratase [Aquibacillus albus]|uniref:3-dehydroquinate dehydratase n=1 Tax=Aquibacillus albus TaxID=1168171 RepID=A0ABS2MYS4_9BACI|nr:type I 3-dehydroquinate dehydratase [Aquibacillus albus]MBM7571027.1 3-dehydroquinate dehydratase-1 [Aquibacillus albus]
MEAGLKVKDVVIGEGIPKICVPLVGETREQLVEEAIQLLEHDIDVVEWRVDFLNQADDLDTVKQVLQDIRRVLRDTPLLFTFRTIKEGGERAISDAYYVQLNQAMIKTGLIDLIDIELFKEEQDVKDLIQLAKSHHVFTIVSNHDFEKTPSKDEMVTRLRRAQSLGADLPKLAVMPTSKSDVLTLLDATLTMKEQYANRPIITMSMAGTGAISRLAGEIFGSALTFGTVKKASAPGQVPIADLRKVLNILHENS